jgi:putative tricarboxylic transport membrane protein
MKFNDLFAGLALLALSAWMAAASWNLPNPAEQPLGPSAFPLILSGLLALCAVILAVNGARAVDRGPLLTRADWTQNPAPVLRLLLVPVAVIFYIAVSETLGFLVVAPLVLLALFLTGGVKPALAIPLALIAALAMHAIFYLGLGVQLPWGLLEPIRW